MTQNLSEQDIVITAANADLTNCAREQIHIPNSIQPHGVLAIADKKTFTIIQVSKNSQTLLGIEREALLNTPLKKLLGAQTLKTIKNCLSLNKDFKEINPLSVTIRGKAHSLIIHTYKGHLFLEFESADEAPKNDFLNFYSMTRKVIDEMQVSKDVEQLSEVIARNVRQLTGFDRVMVYRFAADGSGHVIAEDKQADLEPFKGLRYPATDVPKPARALYQLNYVRLIVDINGVGVPLLPHPETQEPFDLSFASLRSVSPLHVEYLQNMGVRASMSISLLYEENDLWGLVACHHYSQPMPVPYEVRTACEFLGKVMSLNLIAKADRENLQYKMRLKENLSRILEIFPQTVDLSAGLREELALIQSLVAADGVALYLDNELSLHGQTPTAREITDFRQWLQSYHHEDLFHTDNLSNLYPEAYIYKAIASGVVVLYLSRVEGSCIIWFRPEVTQSVTWAGNPNKKATIEADGTLTLTPRKSFALWTESVKGHSEPWQQCEIQQVIEFRNILVDLIFKKSNELLELNFELQRSNDELDSFAYIASHDLKEPLRGIYNYSYLLLEDYEEALEAEGSRKLNTLMTLTKRMEKLIDALLHFSRLGRQELSLQTVDIEELIAKEIKSVLDVSNQDSYDIRISKNIALANADRTLISEVFMNLITNAIKYNKSSSKWVEIGSLQNNKWSSQNIYYVRDNGIGIKPEHKEIVFRIFKRLHGQQKFGGGTGAGLTIVKKIIERHSGKIWLDSKLGEGTTFYFTFSPEHD